VARDGNRCRDVHGSRDSHEPPGESRESWTSRCRGQHHYLFYPLVQNLLASLNGLVGSSRGAVEEKNNITMESFHVELQVTPASGTSFAWDSGCSGEFDAPADTWQLAPGGVISEIVEIIRPCNTAPLFRYLQGQFSQGQAFPEVKVAPTSRPKAT
jgi:hypothetical protein